jgi:hypothetical protein
MAKIATASDSTISPSGYMTKPSFEISSAQHMAVLCQLMKSNSMHKDGFEVRIDRGNVTSRPFIIAPNEKLKPLLNCRRLGMKNFLSANSLIEPAYTMKLALLFIISSVVLIKTPLASFGLSKDQVCFLQDDEYLYLQPFIFSWFPPARIIPAAARLGTTRDPILVELAILLTEMFHRTTIDSFQDIPAEETEFYTVARVACDPDYAPMWEDFQRYRQAVVDCIEAAASDQWTESSYTEFIVKKVFNPIMEEYKSFYTKREPIRWANLTDDLAMHKIYRILEAPGSTPGFPIGRPLFDNFEEPHST